MAAVRNRRPQMQHMCLRSDMALVACRVADIWLLRVVLVEASVSDFNFRSSSSDATYTYNVNCTSYPTVFFAIHHNNKMLATHMPLLHYSWYFFHQNIFLHHYPQVSKARCSKNNFSVRLERDLPNTPDAFHVTQPTVMKQCNLLHR